ncbi:hypothetical protein HPB50_012122 [Hyalomma asiaticum]|uniref:Uncharacterized protein n=1 Tax=Hyalomma asiaticum TaxID=266040 RepID=A0ACB7S2H6_HYAAI|nr:hypothetical protein HPB50_012122 [Hyalomma asiaticum]
MVKIIDWDKFRKNRDQKQQEPIQGIREWNKDILADVEKATMDIEWTDWQTSDSGKGSADREPCEITCIDSRLAHLIQAKKLMQQRLSKQKYNKKLRRRIPELNKEIETQCNRICEQKW